MMDDDMAETMRDAYIENAPPEPPRQSALEIFAARAPFEFAIAALTVVALVSRESHIREIASDSIRILEKAADTEVVDSPH